MQCDETDILLGARLDGELTAEEETSLREHLSHCADCAKKAQIFESVYGFDRRLLYEEVPAGFSADFRRRLAKEKKPVPFKHHSNSERKLRQRPWFRAVAACACLLLMFGLGSASANGLRMGAAKEQSADSATMNGFNYSVGSTMAMSYDNSYDGRDFYSEDVEAAELYDLSEPKSANGNEAVSADGEMERKVIRNWNISMEVSDVDDAMEQLEKIAAEYGGYTVSGESYNDSRYGYLTIRVDAARAEEAVEQIKSMSDDVSISFSSDDITDSYYDVESRLAQYEAQHERLLALYEKAQTISEIISLEDELTRVQCEIDSLQGTLNYYTQVTELSLISIDMYAPDRSTQGVELSGWEAFVDSVRSGFLRNLNAIIGGVSAVLVWIISHIPVLVLLAVVVVLIMVFIRRRKNKTK